MYLKHIRNIKLYQLGISNDGKELYDFLTESFSDLIEYKIENEPKFLYYGKNKKDIIFKLSINNKVTIRIDDYWNTLRIKFNIIHERRDIFKWYLTKILKKEISIGTPFTSKIKPFDLSPNSSISEKKYTKKKVNYDIS